jgi:site-specific recombinase XerC
MVPPGVGIVEHPYCSHQVRHVDDVTHSNPQSDAFRDERNPALSSAAAGLLAPLSEPHPMRQMDYACPNRADLSLPGESRSGTTTSTLGIVHGLDNLERRMATSSLTAAFMDAALRLGKGSTRTREERHATFADFERFARAQRFGAITPATLSLKQVRQYVDHLQARGAGERSIQNRLSHLRAAVRGAGMRAKADAPEWSNAALGVRSPPGARTGKHRAVSDAELRAAQARAAAIGERGREFRVLSELQRCLGLRMQEAVQAGPSLTAWKRSLDTDRPLDVTHGTKGGRGRVTFVPDTMRARAREAVEAALRLAADRDAGRLVDAGSLQAARDRYRAACAAVGLVGEVASHGLRYAWAQDRYQAYRSDGLDEREAVRRLSLDLGHGDGRGRYVRMVYLRGVAR